MVLHKALVPFSCSPRRPLPPPPLRLPPLSTLITRASTDDHVHASSRRRPMGSSPAFSTSAPNCAHARWCSGPASACSGLHSAVTQTFGGGSARRTRHCAAFVWEGHQGAAAPSAGSQRGGQSGRRQKRTVKFACNSRICRNVVSV